MRWALPLLALVLVGLVVLMSNAYRISARLDALQTAQADNLTWLVTQLEIEALKLEGAVISARAVSDPATRTEAEAQVRRAFDVYLSRVAVVAGSIRNGGLLAAGAGGSDWAEILRVTDDIGAALERPGALDLPQIAPRLAELRRAVRRFSVAALALIVDSATRDRGDLRALLNRSVVVSVTLIGMSLAVGGLTFRLALDLRRQGRAEEGARLNLERTLAAAIDGVITAGADGCIQSCNPAAAAMFGYDPGAMAGMPLADVLLTRRPTDAAAARLAAALAAGLRGNPPDERIELTAARRDGTPFPVEVALASDLSSEGRPVLFAFLRDISDQRSFESSLRDARDAALAAADAKARFLAVMSHEMRTPLNGVIAALEILRRTTRLSRRQERFLGVAEGSAALALDQINDVLELARLDGRSFVEDTSSFNLTQMLRQVAEQTAPLAARQGNRLVLNLPDEAGAGVRGMKRLLLRVLINLMGNAAKFTRDGTITLTARLLPGPGGALAAEIEVSDTGIGIPPDQIDRIFDPFERIDSGYARASEGTGLGLGIARRAVQIMQGEISVQSRPGQGSLFRVRLPLEPAPDGAAAPAAEDPDSSAPLPRLRVLIVEDNPTNRIVLREMLERLGQQVTEAPDGVSALEVAGRRAFDLVLMDISMPGMDGLECTRALRAGPGGAARIVGLTAHGAPEELRRFAAEGLADVLVKPMTFAALRAVLAGTPGAAGIDETALVDLRQILSPGARAAAVASFLAEGDAFAALLMQEAPEPLAARAHRLHGSCSLFGGLALAEHLQALERRLRSEGQPPAAAEGQRLIAEWHQLRAKVVLALGG